MKTMERAMRRVLLMAFTSVIVGFLVGEPLVDSREFVLTEAPPIWCTTGVQCYAKIVPKLLGWRLVSGSKILRQGGTPRCFRGRVIGKIRRISAVDFCCPPPTNSVSQKQKNCSLSNVRCSTQQNPSKLSKNLNPEHFTGLELLNLSGLPTRKKKGYKMGTRPPSSSSSGDINQDSYWQRKHTLIHNAHCRQDQQRRDKVIKEPKPVLSHPETKNVNPSTCQTNLEYNLMKELKHHGDTNRFTEPKQKKGTMSPCFSSLPRDSNEHSSEGCSRIKKPHVPQGNENPQYQRRPSYHSHILQSYEAKLAAATQYLQTGCHEDLKKLASLGSQAHWLYNPRNSEADKYGAINSESLRQRSSRISSSLIQAGIEENPGPDHEDLEYVEKKIEHFRNKVLEAEERAKNDEIPTALRTLAAKQKLEAKKVLEHWLRRKKTIEECNTTDEDLNSSTSTLVASDEDTDPNIDVNENNDEQPALKKRKGILSKEIPEPTARDLMIAIQGVQSTVKKQGKITQNTLNKHEKSIRTIKTDVKEVFECLESREEDINQLQTGQITQANMKIATWNCNSSRNIKFPWLRKFDVACIQETHAQEVKEYRGYKAYCIPSKKISKKGHSSGGVATYVKEIDGWTSQRILIHSNILWVMFFHLLGETFVIGNIYRRPGLANRLDQKFFAQLRSDYNLALNFSSAIILAGDFNARIGDSKGLKPLDSGFNFVPSASLDKTINQPGKELILALQDLHLLTINGNFPNSNGNIHPAPFTFFRNENRSAIDFFFVSPVFLTRILYFNILPLTCSDHFTITCALTFQVPQNNKISICNSRKVLSIPSIISLWKDSGIESANQSLNTWILYVQNKSLWKEIIIHKALKGKAHDLKEEIKFVRARMRRSFQRFKRGGNVCDQVLYQLLRKEWYKLIQEQVKLKTEENKCRFHHLLNSKKQSSSKIWKMLKKKIVNVIDPSISGNEWSRHFSKVMYKENRGLSPLDYFTAAGRVDHFLDAPFKEEEIETVIKGKKCKKAPGPSGIPYEHWKDFIQCPSRLKWFTEHINKIFDGKEPCPLGWNNGFISVLYKNKGKTSDVNSYRGISLLETSLKIYEELLADRLLQWSEDKHLFPDVQAGFRNARSTIDNVFIMELIRRTKNYKEGILIALLDLAKAFPSVDRRILFRKLSLLGVSFKFLKALASLYDETEFQVITGNKKASAFKANHGLKEGSCLSPLLFLFFVSDLPKFIMVGSGAIDIGTCQVNVLQFADDTVVLATSKLSLQNILNRFVDYCNINRLKINANKTEILSSKAVRNPNKSGMTWQIDGVNCTLSKVGIYLGVRLQNGCHATSHIMNNFNVGRSRLITLCNVLSKLELKDTKLALRFFDSLVWAAALYGLEIWPEHRLLRKMDTLQNLFYRWFFHIPKSCSIRALRLLLGRCCAVCNVNSRFLMFLHRLAIANNQLSTEAIKEFWKLTVSENKLPTMVNLKLQGFKTFYVKLSAMYPELSAIISAEDFVQFLKCNINKGREKIVITQFCHDNCDVVDSSTLLAVLAWGNTKPLLFASSNIPLIHDAVAILTNSWHFSKKFIQFSKVSKWCNSCSINTLVCASPEHLLFLCPALQMDRNQLKKDLKLLKFNEETLSEILKDQDTFLALYDFSSKILSKLFNELKLIQKQAEDLVL